MGATTTVETLIRARDLIKNVGFHKGWFVSLGEQLEPIAYCTRGALRAASTSATSGIGPTYDTGLGYLEQALKQLRPHMIPPMGSGDRIVYFNDRYDTDADQVIALFDRAIEIAQKEEQS